MDLPNLSLFLFLLLALFLFLLLASTVNAQDFFPHEACATTGNFTADSTYQTTLTALLFSISTTNSLSLTYGFFNSSATISGASQTLYVIGSCLGHLTAESCRTCLNGSASDIRRLCPFQKSAVLYSENCTVRYSDASIFRTVTTDPDFQLFNVNNVTSPDTYNTALRTLLVSLQSEAAGGGSLRKYATGNTSVGFDTIYAMTQCTPDLTEQQCSDCLVTVIARLTNCCAGKIGVRIMAPSCQFRYQTNDQFFDQIEEPLPPPSTPPSTEADAPAPPSGGKSNSTKTIIIAVATSASAVLLVGIVILLIVKRKKQQPRQGVEGEQFDFSTIRAATDDLSNSKMLGRGGFGAVYMTNIAVKRLSPDSEQGELEFNNEIKLLAKLQHRNLVKLLGFCLEGVERLLIYEFVPNSSLDQFIFDPLKRANLNWDRRYKIIIGVARGLLYLHEDSPLCIIHRDLKANNILLDSDMNPKISDFGTARLFELDQSPAKTNRIVGTHGYMAPEYMMRGNFSVKSDVFSFGVLLLEIVCGKKNNFRWEGNNTELLISSVWKNWREGAISNIIDPHISSDLGEEIVRCVHIGLLCVQESVAMRPTMGLVSTMLSSHCVTRQEPSQPGFFMLCGTKSNMSSTQDYSSRASEVYQSRSISDYFSWDNTCMIDD